MFKKKHITIVIVVWNNLIKWTIPCFESILKSSNEFYGTTYDILFVDNASTDGTHEWLQGLRQSMGVQFVRNSENIGYCRAANVGLKIAAQRSDWVLMLNNDTLMHRGFLYQMLQAGENYENTAVVGAKIVRLGNPEWIIHTGTTVEKGDIKNPYCGMHISSVQNTIPEPRLWVNGCAMMIKSDVLKKEGFFNEAFNYYFEEADYCCMLNQKGYSVVWAPQAIVEHAEKATANLIPNMSDKFFRAWDQFVEKWNYYYKTLETKQLPIVGIVLPNYNSEKYIQNTLNSIIKQTYVSWRIYFVDDCSTDNSFNIAKDMLNKFQDYIKMNPAFDKMQLIMSDKLRLLSTPKNGGVSLARNTAHEQIRKDGDVDYIAYIDSDDIWKSNHLELLMKHMIHNKDIDFIYSDTYHTFENGSKAIPFGIAYHTDIDTEKLKTENPIFTSTVIHKTEIIDKVDPFDGRVNSIEDWFYWNKIAAAGFKMYHYPMKTVTYIVRLGGNVAGLRNKEKDEIFKEGIKKIYSKKEPNGSGTNSQG